MKNDINQEIRIGGWNTKATPNDLTQIKNFLKILKKDLINLTIIAHSKKKNTYQEANYRPKNQTLFVDPQILEEMKQTKITLINDNFSSSNSKLLLYDLTPLKSQNNSLKHLYPLFQINYQNETKNRIKELIGKIDVNKLATLQLYQLDPQKLDKYHKPIKTNYKKGLNIIYYRKEDLKYLQSFLTKDKQGYRVKKLHPMYKYLIKKEN
ncbi:phase variable surface lipoprotein ['Elaeagnus angustifolia' witches'-broom phytoplasma]|uniref:Phase variable surface lipoprotein n=1 Tax='Elaeagnus angustifolia' witches'-broom phytoplasma TaxID=1538355 RepID=A0ABS5V9C7_9MOLU|nr:phase variable surface lipoprotein ['Elaeagnus angustifolia' witches'-broom phytoplasma]MBX4180306.1 phase variable surface lipoprotein ['Prunus persica' phytoplasma PP2]MBY7576697.1 phase variable surface lipoprotein [Candidatus Phytoplasma australiense]MCX2955801.1 phase variable surface lipoprotein [Candidatus Phytoplasma australiense]